MSLTAEQRAMRSRIAGLTRWGNTPKEGRTKQCAAMRAGTLKKFLAEVDAAHPGLSDTERYTMAAALERAHMNRLALVSSRARKAGRTQ